MKKYFEEALSDFIHDAASGGAIRHLVDLGYSVEQISRTLSYPTPRKRIQQTVYRYMLESGLIRKSLRSEDSMCRTAEGGERRFRSVRLSVGNREKLYRYVHEKIKENGEEDSYLSCPFGIWLRRDGVTGEEGLRERLACLNKREQDYITGIPWEGSLVYHRLTSRMQEIGRKLILQPELGCRYYFLKTEEMLEGYR